MFDIRSAYADGTAYAQTNINDEYFADFAGEGKTLVVTFFPMGTARSRTMQSDKPWGFNFITGEGYAILGIKPTKVDWYRGKSLHRFFESAKTARFFAGFDRVVFYGGSMGGYGALAYSAAVPGCDVIALSPQTTLNSELVPWESRFSEGRSQDWTGSFVDGAACSATARCVNLFFDPFQRFDRLHAARIVAPNVRSFRVPMVGHNTPFWLTKMGLLKSLFSQVMDDTLTTAGFAYDMRQRKKLPRYYLEMALKTRRPEVRSYCLERAVNIIPNDSIARIEVARIRSQAGDLLGAEADLRCAVELRPTLPHGHFQLSKILASQGRLDEALVAAKSTLALNGRNPHYIAWHAKLVSSSI